MPAVSSSDRPRSWWRQKAVTRNDWFEYFSPWVSIPAQCTALVGEKEVVLIKHIDQISGDTKHIKDKSPVPTEYWF